MTHGRTPRRRRATGTQPLLAVLFATFVTVLISATPVAGQEAETVTYRDDGCTNYEALPSDASGHLPNSVTTFADSCLQRDGQQLISTDIELSEPLDTGAPVLVSDGCAIQDVETAITTVAAVPELGFPIASFVALSYRTSEACGELAVLPRHQPDLFDGMTRNGDVETVTFHHEGCGATVDWEIGPEGGPADNASRFIIETEQQGELCVITNFERRRQLLSVTYPEAPGATTPLPGTTPGEDNPLGPIVIDEEDPLGPTGPSPFEVLSERADLTGDHANIFRLYWAAFDREPDAGGAEFWVDAFNSGSWPTLTRIAEHFVVSDEFIDTYGQMTNARFVEALYLNILDRPSDASGLAFWLNSLNDGTRTRGQVLADFSFSTEFRQAHPLPSDDR